MALGTYKKKRNFRETPEPAGSRAESRSGRQKPKIFVVQKHDATRLHYDFRLEMEGVLKSWTVPKGPPKKVGEKRLAVMTEDHPYAYKDFAGVIPEGNYGAGTVEIWDHGIYEMMKGSVGKGHFSFVLLGKKLKGPYALAHLPSKEGEREDKNWILTKLKA